MVGGGGGVHNVLTISGLSLLVRPPQLIEHLEARLEAAEEYLEGAQAELESLRPPSGTPSTAPAST